jgi:hypothetical protein
LTVISLFHNEFLLNENNFFGKNEIIAGPFLPISSQEITNMFSQSQGNWRAFLCSTK